MGTRLVPMWDMINNYTPSGVARTGVWLIAGTSIEEPYPCRCSTPDPGTWAGRWCRHYGWFSPGCPCWGTPQDERTGRPAGCCAAL